PHPAAHPGPRPPCAPADERPHGSALRRRRRHHRPHGLPSRGAPGRDGDRVRGRPLLCPATPAQQATGSVILSDSLRGTSVDDTLKPVRRVGRQAGWLASVALALAVLILTACGSDDGSGTTSTLASTESPVAT